MAKNKKSFLEEEISLGSMAVPRYFILAVVVFVGGVIAFANSGYGPQFGAITASSSRPGSFMANAICIGGSVPQVYVSWSMSQGAASYSVERRPATSTIWKTLITVSGNVFSYLDTTVVSNKKYYYRVKATNIYGKIYTPAVLVSTAPNLCTGVSPSPTPSSTPTYTPTPTLSYTPTPSNTFTPTPTPSYTPTPTATWTVTPTPTGTVTPTPTPTPSSNVIATMGVEPSTHLGLFSSHENNVSANFSTVNDSFTLTEIQYKPMYGYAAGGISYANLLDGSGHVLRTIAMPASGSLKFAGLTVAMPANIITTLSTSVTTGVPVTTGSNVALWLDYFKATDSHGHNFFVQPRNAGNPSIYANPIYLFKNEPIISAVSLPTTLLVAGTNTFQRFNFAPRSSSSAVGVKRFTLAITKTAGFSLDPGSLKIMEDGVDVSSLGTFTSFAIGTSDTSGHVDFTFNQERQISLVKRYEFSAIISGNISGASLVSTLKPYGSYVFPSSYPNISIITSAATWTDRSAPGHSESTYDWETTDLVWSLPFSQYLVSSGSAPSGLKALLLDILNWWYN